MKKRRWTCIDILKCLAAIAVVEIHKPLEIQGGDEFLIMCRFAVPVFFMITGFFYPETVAKKRELKQFGKIFTITIGANLFYLLWEILLAVEKRENIKEALLARFEKRVPEDFILWNFSPLSPHLWYLQALLYVLVIAFIVEHLGLRKLAYLAIPVLLAGSLIKGSYSLFFVGKEDCHIYYARNFLYCGLPFFWLGCWFGSRKEALLSFLDRKKMGFLLCGLPVFWNMAVMEQKWLVENSLTRALAKVGKDYSMLIYVLHYAVLQALSRCFKGRRSLLAKGYHQYGMMFVFAVTVVMVAVYANARACLKNHSRKL